MRTIPPRPPEGDNRVVRALGADSTSIRRDAPSGDPPVDPTLRLPFLESRRGRWLAALAGAIVLALVVAATTEGVMIRTRNQALGAAHRSDSAARQQLLGARVRLQLLHHDVARLSQEVASLRRTGAGLARQLRARTDQRDVLDLRLQQTLARVTGLQGQNQVFSLALGAGANRLTTTKECLLGVRRALDQASVADFGGAVASLRAVDSQCTTTLARSKEAIGYPAFDGDFADPSIVRFQGRYYGYATNGRAGTVQLLTGSSLASLAITGNALPATAAWADRGRTWSPTVWRRGDRWVMYYAARLAGTNTECISRAVGLSPSGPFLDDSVLPMVCQPELGGSIDPSPYVDATGRPWLLWKSEGPPGKAPTRIWTQQLNPAGTGVEPGTLAELLAPADRWEAGVIEGPSMVRHGADYLLFYSGNIWSTPNYAIGYAVCRSPIGPCVRTEHAAVFRATPPKYGAGGQEFFTDADGSLVMTYHAWVDGEIGYPNPRRLYLARVGFLGGHPQITPIDVK